MCAKRHVGHVDRFPSRIWESQTLPLATLTLSKIVMGRDKFLFDNVGESDSPTFCLLTKTPHHMSIFRHVIFFCWRISSCSFRRTAESPENRHGARRVSIRI